MFPKFDGTPWNPRRFSSAFTKKAKSLKINVTFHGLRHSFASILARAGVPMNVTADAMGHSSTKIMADIYTHVLEGMQRDASQKIGDAFARAKKGRLGDGLGDGRSKR